MLIAGLRPCCQNASSFGCFTEVRDLGQMETKETLRVVYIVELSASIFITKS